jgi:hypothetical protein
MFHDNMINETNLVVEHVFVEKIQLTCPLMGTVDLFDGSLVWDGNVLAQSP